MTASDAARLAAQQSKRGKITVPLGQDVAPRQDQQSVLTQIARGVGPKASGPQLAGPAPTYATPNGYPAAAYGQARPNVQNYQQGREPNRRRR